jgi:hypothetical protein
LPADSSHFQELIYISTHPKERKHVVSFLS